MSGGHDGTGTWRRRPGTLSRTRWWWRVRVVLLAVGVALVPLTLVLGSQETSYWALRQAVGEGELTSVEVSGAPLVGEGVTSQRVRWREGLVAHVATVSLASPGLDDGRAAFEVVPGSDVVDDLRVLAPELSVRRTDGGPHTGGVVAGFEVPSWVALTALGVWLGAVAVAIGSPRTWRLDGWGWGWLLVLVPPLGAVGVLALSGPLPPLPRARRPRRGGGTGLLLAVVVGLVPWTLLLQPT